MILPANPTIHGGAAAQSWITVSDESGGKSLPTRVRPEALTIAPGEFLEPCGYVGNASLRGIVQRSAAKRREAGRKYGSCVQQISIFYHPFAQTGHGFVEHGQYEPVLEVGRYGELRGVGLHRLTIPPHVESLAALAAQFLLLHSLD